MAAKVEGGSRSDAWALGPLGFCIVGFDNKNEPGVELLATYNHKRLLRLVESDPEIQALVQNILQRRKIIQPIKVKRGFFRDKAGVKHERWEVIVGRGRVYACRLANAILKARGEPEVEVPFIIADRGDDDSTIIFDMISENEIRAADSVLNKAIQAKRLYDSCKDMKRVAAAYGVIPGTIADWLKMLEGGQRVLKALEDGLIDARKAILLAQIEIPAERDAALDVVLAGTKEGLRVDTDAVRRMVREVRANGTGALEPEAAGELPAPDAEGKPKAPRAPKEGAATPTTGSVSLSGEIPKRVLAKIVDPEADVELSPKFLAVARAMTEEKYDGALAKLLGEDVYKAIRAIKGFAEPTTVAGLAGAIKTVTTKKAKGTTLVHVVEANKKSASA